LGIILEGIRKRRGVSGKLGSLGQLWYVGNERHLLRNMTGAGGGKLVGVNKESSVGITRVNRQHSVVDILLGTLAVVTGSQQSAGRVGVQTGFQPGGLGVVVVTISVSLGDVLQDDSPVALNVDGTGDLGVVNVAGAQVALRANPVAGVIGRGSLAGAGVVLVVEGLLLGLGDVLDKVISRLVSNVRVLLQEKRVLRDLVGNVVGRVFRVNDTVGQVRAFGTLGGCLGITVPMGMGSRSVWGGSIGSRGVGGGGVGVSGPHGHNRDDEGNTSNQFRYHGVLCL